MSQSIKLTKFSANQVETYTNIVKGMQKLHLFPDAAIHTTNSQSGVKGTGLGLRDVTVNLESDSKIVAAAAWVALAGAELYTKGL